MSVQLQLDRPHAHFTNLDVVTGKVILKLVADEAVSSIVVKLEGESKSRLAGPKIAYNDGRTKKPEVEVHKVTGSRARSCSWTGLLVRIGSPGFADPL